MDAPYVTTRVLWGSQKGCVRLHLNRDTILYVDGGWADSTPFENVSKSRRMNATQLKAALDARPDFNKEKSTLHKLFHNRGYGFMLTPKGHPEIAGCGMIEYCWGQSKVRVPQPLQQTEDGTRINGGGCPREHGKRGLNDSRENQTVRRKRL